MSASENHPQDGSQRTYYKVLNDDGTPYHGGSGKWHLPTGDKPGRWMKRLSPVIPCQRGYHVTTIDNLFSWFGPAIWTVEIDGEIVDYGNKLVAERARLLHRTPWNDRNARLFAADCAEHVLHLFETRYPNDDRPRRAIEAARAYARGEIAADAADAAAHAADAAHAAVYANAAAAHAAYATADAAYAAHDAAAAAAAHAYLAAHAADERRWQTARLTAYLSGEVG